MWGYLGVRGRLVYYLGSFLLLIGGISTFSNLEVNEPIVRRSPASDQDDFGFAAVLHQIQEPVTGDFDSFIQNSKLLIGAPQGTYPGGLSLPPLNPQMFTGLVYICPVDAPGNCDGLVSMETNVSSNDRRLFDGDPNAPFENKTEQLLGSFLASNGDYFMACAPRWVTDPPVPNLMDFDSRRPVGRCFVSPRNLEGFTVIQPCDGLAQANPGPAADANNQCVAGFSGAFLNQENREGTLALGVIGDNLFNGNIFYYNVSTEPLSELGVTLRPRTSLTNLYEGYSTTVGFITNVEEEDVITGVPRNDGTFLLGQVRIRPQNNLTGFAVLDVNGTQTGEYFGYSVAAADLNGDRFDELIVGAPFYSSVESNLQETGRVYVFRNLGGFLNTTPIILTGRSRNLARFGTSVVGLGDLNGDSYEDIAIGSPYELNDPDDPTGNTGAVYIYYGKSEENGFISMSPDQTIPASGIVNTVPFVQSLRTFGFSLFSGIDVDANEVNDLLIGAYESKTAVLLRSLSVAHINVSVSTNTEMVSIDTSGDEGSMFSVQVCASYSGIGLEGRRLEALLEISEVVNMKVPRLFFANNASLNQETRSFVFNSTNVETCLEIPVFVTALGNLSGQVDVLAPLQVEVNFPPIPRLDLSYDEGDPTILVDYRTVPILDVQGINTASVIPSANCTLDENMQEVCNPDLTVTLLNITYLDGDNNTIPQGEAIAEVIETIKVYLRYNNSEIDPAFGSILAFSLPERIVHVGVEPRSLEIECMESTTTSRSFTCALPFILLGSKSTDIALVWRIPGNLIGNEPDDISNLAISLGASTGGMETNVTNNNLINGPIIIRYSAISDLAITRVEFTIDPTTYRGVSFTQVNPTVDEIGQRVQLTVTAANNGPSVAPRSTLNIFVPTNDVPGSYYLYLSSIDNFGSGEVSCNMSNLNPDNLASSMGTRRRRMARMPRQETTSAPQADNSGAVIRDCSKQRQQCTQISCTITNLRGQSSRRIDLTAYLDERFFQSQVNPFVFVATAEIRSEDSFVTDPNRVNNEDSSAQYRVVRVSTETASFPIWIPIVCGIVAVILIIALFILLYFVGFFRRKKLEDTKEAEGDFSPPEADTNGKPSTDKPPVTEAPVEPAADDIGGTDDLDDGFEKPNPEVDDPDETSL